MEAIVHVMRKITEGIPVLHTFFRIYRNMLQIIIFQLDATSKTLFSFF